jgi:formylglycine-generating enzyme required for sulfatase activity
MKRYPDPTCPIGGVTWHEAAAYCNWLSKKEGIPEDQWCYEIKGDQAVLKENYLGRTGYRMHTEAEHEYATRAGAVTARYYGETAELLEKYSWNFQNSQDRAWPVGSKKPNDLGFFDLHGNVVTWCQESHKAYPRPEEGGIIEDKEDSLTIVPTVDRVLRGGSFATQPPGVRSSSRFNRVPSSSHYAVGLRVARTILPDDFTALPPTTGGGRTIKNRPALAHQHSSPNRPESPKLP